MAQDPALLLDSPNRFGYEWTRYSQILPESRDQLQKWLGAFRLDGFKDKTVLDAGCGMGRNPYWMLGAGAKHVTAIDASASALQSARKNLGGFENVTVHELSIYDISPEKLGQFDIVTCIGVLHHLHDPEGAIRKLWSAVKPGGKLILWCYGSEGNEALLPIIQTIRRVVCRLPMPVAHGIAITLTPFVWLALRALPWGTQYYVRLRKFSYRNLESIVLDQIIPRISHYWSRQEMKNLARPLESASEIGLELVQGNSWSMRITKEESSAG